MPKGTLDICNPGFAGLTVTAFAARQFAAPLIFGSITQDGYASSA
jgi:hypothetical protein